MWGLPKYFKGVSFLALNYVKTNSSNLTKFWNTNDGKVPEAYLKARQKIPFSFGDNGKLSASGVREDPRRSAKVKGFLPQVLFAHASEWWRTATCIQPPLTKIQPKPIYSQGPNKSVWHFINLVVTNPGWNCLLVRYHCFVVLWFLDGKGNYFEIVHARSCRSLQRMQWN